MAEKIITHPGYIRNIEGSNAEVVIISTSGCASCEIGGSCSVSDTEEKIIDVNLVDGQNYKRGDHITVEMKQSQGTWAVLLGYVFPFFVVLLSLIILSNFGLDEGLAGLISLLLLVPYYGVMYFLKDTLKKSFSYRVSG